MSGEQSFVVWEGEWPELKRGVRNARLITGDTIVAVKNAVTQQTIDTATSMASSVDQTVHEKSVMFSRFCYRNPWIGQAAVITGLAALATSKSLRWGTFSAVRNGAVVAAIGAGVAFPDQLRQAALQAWTENVTA